jgi:hypothetical protein
MDVRSSVAQDEQFQQDQRNACADDLLYWVQTYVWTYDPRPHPLITNDKNIPFILYPFQEEALLRIDAAIGRHDLAVEKSRDQGASWMFLIVFMHHWLFKPGETFLIVSRNENLVDSPENPDCLFWKLMHLLKNLPPWMQPAYKKTNLHLVNLQNMLDEFAAFEVADGYRALAATQQTTPSRMFNSTPQGVATAHYDIVKPESRVPKLRFHWSQHPVQARGLYTAEKGRVIVKDTEFWKRKTVAQVQEIAPLIEFPDGVDPRAQAFQHYPFVCDGKYPFRSPYFDNECLRTPVDSLIARELEIDSLVPSALGDFASGAIWTPTAIRRGTATT